MHNQNYENNYEKSFINNNHNDSNVKSLDNDNDKDFENIENMSEINTDNISFKESNSIKSAN